MKTPIEMTRSEYIEYHIGHCLKEAKRSLRQNPEHKGRGKYRSRSARQRKIICAIKQWKNYQANGLPDDWKPKEDLIHQDGDTR